MKQTRNLLLVTGAALTLAAGIANAHHSFAAAYDTSPEKAIKITGKIVDVRLTNPHSFFFLDVEGDDGQVVRWSFEAGTPSAMIRNGYSPQVIREGDVVTITGFPARDASKPNGMLRQLTTADGTVYGMFGPQESPGAR